MTQRRSSRSTVGLWLTLALLAGCGGGSGSGNNPPAGPVATYGNTTLPGRMLVNKGAQVGTARRAAAFDLTTAQRVLAPVSATDPDADEWSTGARAAVALRSQASGSQTTVSYFHAATGAALPGGVALPAGTGAPQMSADGQYLLAFVGNTLTIFSAATGAVVEDVSNLDGFSIIGTPAAWLPDGRYVYLAGKTLYRTTPLSPDTDTVATLALPGPTPSAVMNSDLAVSPDGSRIGLSWLDRDTEDTDLWVVHADGSALKQMTRSTQPDALDYTHASPTWSPDGRWLAGVLYMSGTSSSPIYPDEPFLGARVTGSTGCIDQVFVVDANGPTVQLAWPSFDAAHGLKVIAASGSGGQWLSTCSGKIAWLP